MVATYGVITKNGTFVSMLTISAADTVLLKNGTFKAYSELTTDDRVSTSTGEFLPAKFQQPD